MNLKKILKSVVILSFSEFVSRAINFVSYAILARAFLVEGFGSLSYVFAIVSYIILFVNFGTDTVGIREIASNNTNHEDYVRKLLSYRLTVAAFLYVFLIICLSIVHMEQLIKSALLIYGLTLFSNALLISWYFRGIEKNEYIAITQIFSSCLNLLAIFLLVQSLSNFLEAIWIYTISSFINSGFLIFLFLKKGFKLFLVLDRKFIKELLVAAAPIGISVLMINIYYNFDHILLGTLGYKSELGYYAAAYKILLVAIIPASLIWQSFYPQLSNTMDNPENRIQLMDKYSKIMFMLGMFITLLVLMFCDEIIYFVYGAGYERSSKFLFVLALNILLVFVNVVYGNPLIAWKKQKSYSMAIVSGAVINIILNYLLIPKYLGYGAAIATIASELAVLFGVVYIHERTVETIYGNTLFGCLITGLSACLFLMFSEQYFPKSLSVLLVFFVMIIGFVSFGIINITSIKRFITNEI